MTITMFLRERCPIDGCWRLPGEEVAGTEGGVVTGNQPAATTDLRDQIAGLLASDRAADSKLLARRIVDIAVTPLLSELDAELVAIKEAAGFDDLDAYLAEKAKNPEFLAYYRVAQEKDQETHAQLLTDLAQAEERADHAQQQLDRIRALCDEDPDSSWIYADNIRSILAAAPAAGSGHTPAATGEGERS